MTASLIVVAMGAVAAAVGTAGLTARLSRAPGLFLLAWTVAVFGLAVALAAQALGDVAGYSELIFRTAELAAQAIAPLFICLGLVELVGRSVVTRFGMRLAVAAIGVIVLVVLGSDPLSLSAKFSTAWPDPAHVYQFVPVGLIEFLAAFAVIIAVLAGLAVLARSGRGRDFADVVRPGLLASGAAVAAALPGVAMLAGTTLGGTGFALAGVLAVGLTWFAATTAARLDLAAGDRRPGEAGRRVPGDDSGRFEPRGRARDGFGGYDADIGYPALAALAAERPEPPAGYDPGAYDAGRHHAGRPGHGGYDPDGYGPGRGDPPPALPAGYEAALETYRQRAVTGDGEPPGGADLQPNLFGQITIYTLLEERLDEFDRMTERVVEQVRAREPGTLVYIVHAVPTAPMQRILYEVYQDRPAYDDHLAQPYMTRYLAARRPMVLATNAIELGLQQAKVSPLASYSAISDILSESGIDLTGVTRPARGASAARGGRHGAPAPDLPAPGSDRYGPLGRDDDRSPDGGWDAVRGEDRYR